MLAEQDYKSSDINIILNSMELSELSDTNRLAGQINSRKTKHRLEIILSGNSTEITCKNNEYYLKLGLDSFFELVQTGTFTTSYQDLKNVKIIIIYVPLVQKENLQVPFYPN